MTIVFHYFRELVHEMRTEGYNPFLRENMQMKPNLNTVHMKNILLLRRLIYNDKLDQIIFAVKASWINFIYGNLG